MVSNPIDMRESYFEPMGDTEEGETTPLLGARSQQRLMNTDVYPVIQLIREDAIHYIDTALSYEALTSPDMTYSLVRPLTEKYNKLQNMAVPFCLLLNRANFLRDRNIGTRGLSLSRAELCEILAIRTLRHWASDSLDLATVLTTSWMIFNGADEQVMEKVEDAEDEAGIDGKMRIGNAIEMAILGQAKRFIKSAAAQKIIDGIWSGRIIYTPEGMHAILSDTYKRAPVHLYDPLKAPLLDHYRLKVPSIRSKLEYLNFLILFILFIIVLETNELPHINNFEWFFMVYAIGFTVDRLASMQEHGIKLYSSNLWNGFDIAFILTFLPYLSLRLYGAKEDIAWAREWSIDILAVAAVFMFPRLAFVSLSNNLMILSLRSMFSQFFQLMALAVFCFAGFLYALWTFGKAHYTATQIAWWMADLWFGLDASGFEKAAAGDFHKFFGPPLVAVYACCSNTLLLTVLVSILSHTFSIVVADAAAEAMFRRAVTTIEGVKADVLFSYQPPLNLFAFLFMFPLSFILTPRWFHKVNVLMIRITAFPILLVIGIYERSRREGQGPKLLLERANALIDKIPRRFRPTTLFENFAGQGSDIDAIFEIEAQVVDDVLNERTRGSVVDGHASKPHSPTPSHRDDSPPPPFRSLRNSSAARSPSPPPPSSSPPMRIPQPMSSPGQMSNFPSSSVDSGHDDMGSPTPSRARREAEDERSARTENGGQEGTGPASLEVFRSDSGDSQGQHLPTILRTPPPRPALPPRHVRTRRDSHAVQSFRAAALAGMQTSNGSNGAQNGAQNQNGSGGEGSIGWHSMDPFALNPPMSSIPMPETIAPSPLGQLYGTVVIDEDQVKPASGPGLGIPQARRMRTMSAGAAALLEPGNGRAHRRVSSSGSARPFMWGRSHDNLPETVQEAEDDAEEETDEKNGESKKMMTMMKEMHEQQQRLEKQIKELVSALSGGGNK